jgi:hypothetical protein
MATEIVDDVDIVGCCMRINTLLAKAPVVKGKDDTFKPDLLWISEKLVWEPIKLMEFMACYEPLLNYENGLWKSTPEVILPPSDADLLCQAIPDAAPTMQDIAAAIERSNSDIVKGLRKIGLSEEEAIEAEALQQFNQRNFKESMDMVSSNALRTSLKLATQQRKIEERLVFVRVNIGVHEGEDEADRSLRSYWIKEENHLLDHYARIAEILNKIQETFYRGTAALAVIKMRMRDHSNGITQRNKPRFGKTFNAHGETQTSPPP